MELLYVCPLGQLRAMIQARATLWMTDDVLVIYCQHAFPKAPDSTLVEDLTVSEARIEPPPVDSRQESRRALQREQVPTIAKITGFKDWMPCGTANALQPLNVRIQAHRPVPVRNFF